MIDSFFSAEGMACTTVREPLWDDALEVKELPQAEARRLWRARLICRSCPVRLRCQSHGIEHKESGVWGAELLNHGAIVKFPPVPKWNEPEHGMSEPIATAPEAHHDGNRYAATGDCP